VSVIFGALKEVQHCSNGLILDSLQILKLMRSISQYIAGI